MADDKLNRTTTVQLKARKNSLHKAVDAALQNSHISEGELLLQHARH